MWHLWGRPEGRWYGYWYECPHMTWTSVLTLDHSWQLLLVVMVTVYDPPLKQLVRGRWLSLFLSEADLLIIIQLVHCTYYVITVGLYNAQMRRRWLGRVVYIINTYTVVIGQCTTQCLHVFVSSLGLIYSVESNLKYILNL